MLIAPGWFLRELEMFDPALRVRWSVRLSAWQLERKVANGAHPECYKTDDQHDDYIRARDGYILVATIPPNGLGRGIFDKLRDSDLWARGGWESVAKEIEDFEAREEESKWNTFHEDMRHASAELYELLKWRDGRKMLNAGVGQ